MLLHWEVGNSDASDEDVLKLAHLEFNADRATRRPPTGLTRRHVNEMTSRTPIRTATLYATETWPPTSNALSV